MKTCSNVNGREGGSVLLVSLIVAMIVGITVGSYLLMIQSQNVMVTRSQVWNNSMTLTEAGVEEGLSFINKYAGDFMNLPKWTNVSSVSADHWTDLGNNVYAMQREVDPGMGYYNVYVTNLNNCPSVYSVGTAYWKFGYASAAGPYFAAVGVLGSSTPKPVTRSVLVQTKIDPLFAVAMAAILTIDFNGKNVTTDSFDSADPNYSDSGKYPASVAKTKDAGDVCTDLTIINSINVGNAKIKGRAKTGPNGTIAIGPNGSVGDRAWVEGGSKGIKPGWSASDMNVLFPPIDLPNTTWLAAPSGGVLNGSTYDTIIRTSGDYTINGLNNGVYIGTNANVRLKVTGNVKFTGTKDLILIASTNGFGGSLMLYSDTPFDIAGQGIVNQGGNAANFYLLGTTNCTSINFSGNASFTGAIYAPNATFSLGGGGNDSYDFVGASITKTVRMNGHFKFHYDENLRRVGPGRGYIPTNWGEK